VTLFNRNLSAPGLFPDLELIAGDRTKDLSALRGRRWDAVVDMCGYSPDDVKSSVELLRDQVERYVFISAVMVYRSWGARNLGESAPQYADGGAETAQTNTAAYRLRKSLCDRLVREALPDRALVIRPGMVVGPHDPAEALQYWLLRAMRGGEALAPGDPERQVQVIDARDLAGWIVAMAAKRAAGVFNACGRGVSMKKLLGACAAASRGKAKFTWVDKEFLLDEFSSKRDIRERPLQFLEFLPFWIPGLDDRFSSAAAQKQGLTRRPVADTIRDTLASMQGRRELQHAFLDPDREAALLDEWRGRSSPRRRPRAS
jgi:2'-hydroxyisoflavone reductase